MTGKINASEILKTVNAVLEKPIIQDQVEMEFSNIGIDSITFIRMIVSLEETFEIEIPDEKLSISEINTIVKITETVNEVLSKQK